MTLSRLFMVSSLAVLLVPLQCRSEILPTTCSDTELKRWADQERLLERLTPEYPEPLQRLGKQGSTVAFITVTQTGQISGRLKESSGHAELDQLAMVTIERAKKAKVKYPSCEKSSQGFSFELPFNFHIKQLSAEKRQLIENMLRIGKTMAGARLMSESLANSISAILKDRHPDVPDRVLDVIREEADKVIAQNLFEEQGMHETLVQLYDKYYSEDEIRALTEFYRSPIGQKTIGIEIAFTQDLAKGGEKFIKFILPILQYQIETRLRNSGDGKYLLPRTSDQAPRDPSRRIPESPNRKSLGRIDTFDPWTAGRMRSGSWLIEAVAELPEATNRCCSRSAA